jgi:flavin reductase (DIM6/NTAB) family NADH-FMN oxidoreductase RutF
MKKPWNRINLPIYSISVKHGNNENMNIATYVSSISLTPKKMMVCLYKNTKTLEIAEKNPHFIIQLLSKDQINLVRLLGKTSGFKKDKMDALEKKDLLIQWKGFKVLKDSLAFIEVKAFNFFEAGDHIAFLCDVIAFKNIHEGSNLTLDDLRKQKIISC